MSDRKGLKLVVGVGATPAEADQDARNRATEHDGSHRSCLPCQVERNRQRAVRSPRPPFPELPGCDAA